MLKEKFEKTKNFISRPIPCMVMIHCLVVMGLCLLTAASDYIYSLALAQELSQSGKMVCIFLFNSIPFTGVSVAVLKAVSVLCQFIPEEQLLYCYEDEENDDSEFTLHIPLKQLLLIIVIIVVTAMAVAITFHNHIGFSSRLYNANSGKLFEISTVSL